MRTRVSLWMAGLCFTAQAWSSPIPIPDDLDAALAELIQQHGLTGDPLAGTDLPDISDPEAQLGKLLFFSKALSGNKDVACASCHHPYLGGGDGLSLSVGSLATDPDILGPGRLTSTGELYVPRNAPTIFNAWAYKRGLFRDARVEFVDWENPQQGISTPDVPYGEADPAAGDTLLAAQARFPVITDAEMRGFDFMPGASNEAVRAHLAARIGDYGSGSGELFRNQWRERFAAVYGPTNAGEELVTFANISRAIAAYQQSMVFVDNPWYRYVRGDKTALTESQKRGAFLYYFMPPPPSDGGTEPDFLPTQCIGCHNTDTFTQTKESNYHRLAFPQIGPGTGSPGAETNDLGRTHRNGDEADLFSFRSGTLLNIEVTGPYGHAGNYDTLEQVIEHYNDYRPFIQQYFDNKGWCSQPQFTFMDNCQSLFPWAEENTEPAAVMVDDEIADGAPVLQPLQLNAQDKADLVNFMKALTDPCVKDAACLQAWLPQRSDGDPDGLLLNAKNYQGVPLYLPSDCRQGDTLASGAMLRPNQGECVSGQWHFLSFDVPSDNTLVYLSTRDGEGQTQLFVNPHTWATPENAIASSVGEGTEQVLTLTLNRGRHYVTVGHPEGYRGVSVALALESAVREPGERPLALPDVCQQQPALGYGEVTTGEPVCVQAERGYFFVQVAQANASVEIRTRHGEGDLNLLAAPWWPTDSHYAFSSKQPGNDEYLRIDAPTPGWYYLLVSGGAHRGASLQVDIRTTTESSAVPAAPMSEPLAPPR
ncbi:cytochrome C peroxidase [Bacterioplanes sanyensis]|uniref:Cytochrome C peroxidase n=1 Tax=Bacterioplanes sanyensis TaxID=1249553 RepID=A0A222FGL4_9GAMM|nr:cytochrome c peroxidase [Bacterioplanes sanyensis]ASP38207.1 cytochrome C peroxidase [Bacterioplanes sanyensis]